MSETGTGRRLLECADQVRRQMSLAKAGGAGLRVSVSDPGYLIDLLEGAAAEIRHAQSALAAIPAARASGRAEGTEEAAKVADDYDTGGFGEHRNMAIASKVSAEIRDAILALRSDPAEETRT